MMFLPFISVHSFFNGENEVRIGTVVVLAGVVETVVVIGSLSLQASL